MKVLRRAAVLSIGLLAVCLLAVGCTKSGTSSQAEAKAPTPEGGQCIGKEIKDLDDLAPDFNDVVDCTKSHVYEVVDVIVVPKQFLTGSTKADRAANRKELATVKDESALKTKFEQFASASCGQATLKAVGPSKLRIAGKTASSAGVDPVMGGALNWLNLTPTANWIDGDAKLVCSIRYTKHIITTNDVGPQPVEAKTELPAYADFLTKDFPLDRRQCVTYDGKGQRPLTPCDEEHYGEMFFSFDARKAFGDAFVKSVDLTDPHDANWAKISRVCTDALPLLLGEDIDSQLTAVAEPGPGGWDGKSDYYGTNCLVAPKHAEEFDLPGGTLIGNAKQVDFVPFTASQEA